MTMYAKEYDFLRYLRMSNRSPFLKQIYSSFIEKIECDQVIFIPMIDGVNLTHEKIKKYENQDYKLPGRDQLTPVIKKAI